MGLPGDTLQHLYLDSVMLLFPARLAQPKCVSSGVCVGSVTHWSVTSVVSEVGFPLMSVRGPVGGERES